MWIAFAAGSAVFAGLTAVLAKVGIKNTTSNVATAIRTVVVLAAAWLMVLVVGSAGTIGTITPRTWLFLVLSGLATGASWLCYFRALKLGDVRAVVPVDKSSIILTVLLAIIVFGETDSLIWRLVGIAVIGVGTYLMIPKADEGDSEAAAEPAEGGGRFGWLGYAVLSAVFAALTAILGKVGISGVESNLGTALRTIVVLAMAWLMVFVSGEQGRVRGIPRRDLVFICLSGLATGASWLCYFHALQTGPASLVVPIDKLSIVISVGFAALFLGERPTRIAWLGLALIVVGTLIMLL